MADAFTRNSKTVVSVDFDRFATCTSQCSYCYVGRMEGMYKAYAAKIKRNHLLAKETPKQFADQLNSEYRKLRNRKLGNTLQKLPVRIYGSGDYIKEHYTFLKNLNFKFFIISKSLTRPEFREDLKKLLALKNVTKIILSFDKTNIGNYDELSRLYGKDKIGFSFTGMADEFDEIRKIKKFTIFFNIAKTNIEIEKSRKFSERCPCTSKENATEDACTRCNKCWRSSITKTSNWNN